MRLHAAEEISWWGVLFELSHIYAVWTWWNLVSSAGIYCSIHDFTKDVFNAWTVRDTCSAHIRHSLSISRSSVPLWVDAGIFFRRVWASKKCKPFCFTRFKGARPSATRRYCLHRPHLSRAQHLIKRPGRYYGVTLPQKPNGGMSSLEAQGLAVSAQNSFKNCTDLVSGNVLKYIEKQTYINVILITNGDQS